MPFTDNWVASVQTGGPTTAIGENVPEVARERVELSAVLQSDLAALPFCEALTPAALS